MRLQIASNAAWSGSRRWRPGEGRSLRGDVEACPGPARTHPAPAPRRRYRSRLREERAADTRRRITLAAGELFAAHGFAGTTVAGIAARAGVSEATVYATFGTKGAVARAILGEMEQQADVAGWMERIAAESDPRRKLRAFARWTRALFASTKATIAAVSGALTDPALIELGQEGSRRRREGLR